MKSIAVFAVALATVLVASATNVGSVSAAPNKNDKVTTKKTQTEKKHEVVKVKIVEGDTLSAVAEKHETTWVRIFNANEQIANPNIINPGDEVRIPHADEKLADRPLPEPVVSVAATPAPTFSAQVAPKKTATYQASYPVSPNAAKAFIYQKESGNNPNATNPIGCYGIGQDCNGIVRDRCGANYECQDAYFTDYAMRRYGSWEAAYAFWQSNRWW